MTERRYCNQPDRDVPGIKCGFPLPCPWHTIIIEKGVVDVPKDLKMDKKTSEIIKSLIKSLGEIF